MRGQRFSDSYKYVATVLVASIVIVVVVVYASLGFVSWESSGRESSGLTELKFVVYQSPWCGCCERYKEYLVDHGYSVETVKRLDMDRVKREFGVPEDLWSCHTMVVGEYVVEGHVPLEAIEKLLAEKPSVRGIAVPGMPPGVPGMEGPGGEVTVYWFRDGETGVFMVVDLTSG